MLRTISVLFFFVKQKTAYEMRISDWSSDVCSSDLFPSTVAMVGNAVGSGHLGLGLGIYGTLKNLGKVAGPLVAGALLEFMDYEALFVGLAALAFASSLGVLLAHPRQRPAAVENALGCSRDTPRGGSLRATREPARHRATDH